MFIANLKMMASVVVALGIVGTGTGIWWHGVTSQPGAGDTRVETQNTQTPAKGSAASSAKPEPGGSGPGIGGGKAQSGAGLRQPAKTRADAVNVSSDAPLATRQLRQHLDKPADINFDDNIPLSDALHSLLDRFDIPILVESEAFRNDVGLNDIRNQTVTLPHAQGAKLRMVLRLLLDQVQGDFQLREGVLFVIPKNRVTSGQVFQHPVNASFQQIPLNVALQKLSDQSGVSVVLDLRTAEKGQLPVTADLDNVPLRDAVRVLTDMAGLRPVVLDNVIYVTSPENSVKMEADKKADPTPPQPAAGTGS